MANNFWFKFNFKDWANDVKPLSLNARGLLVELIIHLRQCDPVGEMPNDIRLLVRLTGALTNEITEAINEFRENKIFDFEIREGKEFLISRRINKEKAKSLIAIENGSKGGNPELIKKTNIWLTKKVNQELNQTHNFNSIFNFDLFYNNYGKKVGKEKAKKAFDKLTIEEKQLACEKSIDWVKCYVTDIKFQPHPTTWLNGKRWEDEMIIKNIPALQKVVLNEDKQW